MPCVLPLFDFRNRLGAVDQATNIAWAVVWSLCGRRLCTVPNDLRLHYLCDFRSWLAKALDCRSSGKGSTPGRDGVKGLFFSSCDSTLVHVLLRHCMPVSPSCAQYTLTSLRTLKIPCPMEERRKRLLK